MLNIYFNRKFSFIITACSAALAIAGGTGLAKAGSGLPVIVQVIGWILILLMVWGVIVGVRQLLKPPLMYRADRRGVMIFYAADTIKFTDGGVFLPWTLVTSMALEKRTGAGAMNRRAYTWVVACQLKSDAPFPVQQHSVAYEPGDGQKVVCLDAFTGTLSGQAMLGELRTLWQAATLHYS